MEEYVFLCYLLLVSKPSQIKKLKIPSFFGSCEVRLRDACDWISKNDPGRCLTLEEIASILQGTTVKVGGQVTAGNIFTCFPQHDQSGPTDDCVQIDWMVGDIEWLRWSYYSHGERDLKGLHRTQLLVAAFSEIGYTFSHFSGIKKKGTSEWTITTPEDALGLLSEHYAKISVDQTQTFAQLHSWLLKADAKLYFAVVNRYKEILRLARAEVPIRLQQTI